MDILIATAGTSYSDVAVRLGGHLYYQLGGVLTLLTVTHHELEQAQAEALLFRARTLLDVPPAQVRSCIRTGQAPEEIVRQAAACRHDLIIIGGRPRRGLARLLLAPVAERVIAQMPCPVLIARGEPRPLRRVLVCEGGRDPSLLERLLRRLAPLLESAEALTVLHVMSQMAVTTDIPDWELSADAGTLIQKRAPEGDLLAADLARLERLQVRLEAKVRHGLVVAEILSEARDGDYDLIVIGAHQGRAWERYLLDDLAHEIISHADRPLLVV